MIELIDEFKNGNNDLSIYNRSIAIMNTLFNEGVFSGKWDRHAYSTKSHLIHYNNDDIGFIYLIQENRLKSINGNPVLFIDMGIKKEYRGHGIGTYVLKEYIALYGHQAYLIGEVKKDNFSSNELSKTLGRKILESNTNYYLFGDKEDFDLKQFKNAIESDEMKYYQKTKKKKA